MPSAITGFTRNELVADVSNMIGSNAANLISFLNNNITNYQNEFLQLHDWSFAHNTARSTPPSFSTVISQRAYDLVTLSVNIDTTNIESIVCISTSDQRKLIKTTLDEARESDPGGIVVGKPTFYFPLTRTQIELWPVPNVIEDFVVEGKLEPGFISGPAVDYNFDIPYKYQGTFKQYVYVNALRYEKDPREAAAFQVFNAMLSMSIRDDMRNLESNLRMLTTNEVIGSPGVLDINQRLWYTGWY